MKDRRESDKYHAPQRPEQNNHAIARFNALFKSPREIEAEKDAEKDAEERVARQAARHAALEAQRMAEQQAAEEHLKRRIEARETVLAGITAFAFTESELFDGQRPAR